MRDVAWFDRGHRHCSVGCLFLRGFGLGFLRSFLRSFLQNHLHGFRTRRRRSVGSDKRVVEAAAAAASRAASALAGAGAVLGAGMAALDDSAVSGTRGSFVGVSGGALGLGTAPALAAGAPPAPPAPPPPPAGFFFFLPPAIVWRTTGKARRNVMTPIDGRVLQRKIQFFRDRIGEKCAASSAQSTVRIHLGCVRRFGAHTHLFAPRTLGDSST